MACWTHPRFARIFYLTVGLAILALFFGCGETSPPNASPSTDPCGGVSEGYGTLPQLRETSHPELRKEYVLLVEHHHTPCQLVKADENPGQNAAVALDKAISKFQAETILKETYFLTQSENFEFSVLHLKRIKELADHYRYKNLMITKAMERPVCLFAYDHTKGLMADDSFVEQVLAASRLQEIDAANFLFNVADPETRESQKTSTAIDPSLEKTIGCLETIFRLADGLAQVQQVRARLVAVSIRKDACRVLQAVVDDRRCNKATLMRLQKIVQEELSQWRSDAEMWIGDRALGLYIYEAVRDGLILSILNEEETEKFRKEGTLKHLTKAAQESADEDQRYYLMTMRNLIDGCRRDFYKRPLLGPKIVGELKRLENSPRYPLVAAKVLLRDVDSALLLQMIDLARIRAWSVALDLAVGKKPTNSINPLNGEPFFITRSDETIVVRVVPEKKDAEMKSPLDDEARQFITEQWKPPVTVPVFSKASNQLDRRT